MDTNEALGYLKGLIDGLDLDENKKETKVYKAIIQVLETLNEDVLDITEELDIVEEQLDDLDEDLATVEEFVFDDDDDDFSCDCCSGCDEEYEEYEIECPNCNEVFSIDEETVLEGSVECPNCGEVLQLEVEIEEAPEE